MRKSSLEVLLVPGAGQEGQKQGREETLVCNLFVEQKKRAFEGTTPSNEEESPLKASGRQAAALRL